MTNKLLFPRWLRLPGLLITLTGLLLFAAHEKGYEISWLNFSTKSSSDNLLAMFTTNYTASLSFLLILLGLVFTAFSRLKQEDEMTAYIRLRSWQLSIYLCVLLLGVLIAFTFDIAFLYTSFSLWFLLLASFSIIFYGKIYLFRRNN